MPLDGIAVTAITKELNAKLVGGRIEKVHQPEKDELWLYIKNLREQYKLIMSADSSNPRVHLTDSTKQNPLSAPMFCMLLRKHISGGRIKSVTQPSFERILDIEIESRDELGDLREYHIICELMGRHSNIILVSGDKVIDSIKHVDITVSSVRCVLPGLSYCRPPSQDKLSPFEANYDKVFEAFLSCDAEALIEKAVVRLIGGTSPLIGREIAYRAVGDVAGRLTANNLKSVSDVCYDFISILKNGKFSPCVVKDPVTGKTMEFATYDVTLYGNLAQKEYYDDISEAMDEFYCSKDKWERMRHKGAATRKVVTNALERCKKKLQLQQEKLAEAAHKDEYKIFGDLITANLYRIKEGEDKVSLENFYDENLPVVEIPMDTTKSPSKNAAFYFSKYRKAKTAEEMVSVQLSKNLDEIEYLTSVLGTIDIAETEQDIMDIRQELTSGGYIKSVTTKKNRQKPLPSKPLKFEYMGYEIYVGRNNNQNDYVTLKLGKSYDMWLHTKDIPGSHVLIKNQGEEIPNEVVEVAASLAAYYSSGRESSMLEVDYTLIRNVKKPSGAMPGKVIYVSYKTAYVPPKKFKEQ